MRLLLAIDSAAASDILVSHARKRQWPEGAGAEVLCVLEPFYIVHAPDLGIEIEQAAQELVRTTAEKLRSCGLDTDCKVLQGDPKDVIVDRAAEIDADFVWLAAHRSADGQFLAGGTMRAVLRVSPCSVAIIRASEAQLTKVLLATDGSDHAKAAAQSIAARPWPAKTEVKVLSVVELAVSLFQPPFPRSAMEEIRTTAMQHAQDAIGTASKILAGSGVQLSEDVSVLVDSPKSIILDEAAGWGADLIVVGSHGRRGVSRFLLGSVSESIAMHANCSVEVIRGVEQARTMRPVLVQPRAKTLVPST
jgi:nucleotide-binding universal stress UspA family protein